MAPCQPMLPVRRDRHPPGALSRPLPLPASTSVNTRPLAPPATPGRGLYDQSHFNIDVLLDTHTAGDQDALIDQAEPSWLADESAFTFGARTPARARATTVLDDDSMLQDGPLGQVGDGDTEAAHDDLLVETVDTSPVTQAPQAALAPSPTPEPGPALGRPPTSPSSAAPLADEPTPARDLHDPSPSPSPSQEPARAESEPAPSVEPSLKPVAPAPPSPSFARRLSPGQAASAFDAVDAARSSSTSYSPAPSVTAPQPVHHRSSPEHLSADTARPPALDDYLNPAPPEGAAGPSHDLFDVVEEPVNASAPRSPVDQPARQPSSAPATVALLGTAASTGVAPPADPEPAQQVANDPSLLPPPPVEAAPAARRSLAPSSRPFPPVASSSTLPPLAQPTTKRPSAEKGVRDVDEEAKRHVREAKAKRERATCARQEQLARDAAARKTVQRYNKGAAHDKVESAQVRKATRAARHEPAPAPVPAPAPAPVPAPAPAPAWTRTSLGRSERVGSEPHDDSPLPVFAFDAVSSLPTMGAPLDFALPDRECGRLGLGADEAQVQGVTSTPARPVKRKAGGELAVEKVVSRAAPQLEVETSRRTFVSTSAPVPSRDEPVAEAPGEAKLEERADGDEPDPAPVAHVKPQRRASRISLAQGGSNDLAASTSSALGPGTGLSTGKAVRVVLVAPAPADPGADATAGPALLAASVSSSTGAMSRSQRRASRVPVDSITAAGAAAPPVRPAPPNASTSSRRAGRSSLAPPPPTPPTRHAQGALVVEPTRAEETLSLFASGSLNTSTRRASRVFTVVEELVTAQGPAMAATSSALRASVPSAPLKNSNSASTSRPRSASTSHPHVSSGVAARTHTYVEPPRVPPPPGKVIGGVTLPSSFSFADAESELAIMREAEQLRRVAERERREQAGKEADEERKRKRGDGGSAWAVAGVCAAREGEAVKRQRLVDPLARSTSSTAPPHLAASSPLPLHSHLALPPAAERSRRLSSSPAAQVAVEPAAPAPAHEPLPAADPIALTREALERNTRRAGPRVDLERRVSMWALEGVPEDVEEEEEEEAAVAAVVDVAAPQQEEARQEDEVVLEEEQVEQSGHIEQPAPVLAAPVPAPSSVAVVTAAQPAPALAAAPTSTEPLAATTRPRTAAHGPSSSSAAAAGPSRRAPPHKSAAAAPAAPRRAQPSAAAPASPLFTAQLGAWKARERSTLGGGARGAARVPVPAPLAAAGAPPPQQQHAAGTRVRRALEAAAPAPGPAKRARVASAPGPAPAHPLKKSATAPAGPRRAPVAVQQAKENAPAAGSSAAAGAAAAAAAAAAAPKTGVAAELEQQRRLHAEWSERQKQREEDVKRHREEQRKREAEKEREKLMQLRASLARGGPPAAARGGARRAGRV